MQFNKRKFNNLYTIIKNDYDKTFSISVEGLCTEIDFNDNNNINIYSIFNPEFLATENKFKFTYNVTPSLKVMNLYIVKSDYLKTFLEMLKYFSYKNIENNEINPEQKRILTCLELIKEISITKDLYKYFLSKRSDDNAIPQIIAQIVNNMSNKKISLNEFNNIINSNNYIKESFNALVEEIKNIAPVI